MRGALKPGEVARAWSDEAKPAIFSASLGRDGDTLTLHPLKSGVGYLFVIWRHDRNIARLAPAKCIRAGGRSKATTLVDAIIESAPQLAVLGVTP
jgi:hypothetical protein